MITFASCKILLLQHHSPDLQYSLDPEAFNDGWIPKAKGACEEVTH
jgi:hypothetical protein